MDFPPGEAAKVCRAEREEEKASVFEKKGSDLIFLRSFTRDNPHLLHSILDQPLLHKKQG